MEDFFTEQGDIFLGGDFKMFNFVRALTLQRNFSHHVILSDRRERRISFFRLKYSTKSKIFRRFAP